LKDIVAAKNMNMRSIWAVGLVRDKLLNRVKDKNSSSTKAESSMDMGELMKQISSQTVVSLGIGADDYLAASLTGEFVDAVAEDFADIASILLKWHAECKIENSKPTDMRSQEDIDKPTDSLSVTPVASKVPGEGVDFIVPRAFRIVRADCTMDVPAPLKNRESRTMKDVMGMAQLDKSSGVFAFPPEDVALLQEGKKVLMVQIGDTGLQFSREMFSAMTVEEVLSLTDKNPVILSFTMKEAVGRQSFDLF